MDTPKENTKSRPITREHWKPVVEALAWAVVAAFAMLLLQARQVDRWDTEARLVVLLLVLLFGVAVTCLRRILFSQLRQFKSVEAESFVLKQDGTVLAKLGRNGRSPIPSLDLYNASGAPSARFGWDENSQDISLSLYDWAGKEQVRLSHLPLLACDLAGQQGIVVARDGMALYHSDGAEKLSVTLSDGEPTIRLSQVKSEGGSIRMAVDQDGPGLALLDKDGSERVSMVFFDNESHITLSASGDQTNLIHLAVEDGDPSLTLDQGSIQVLDSKSDVIWSAP